MIYEENFQNDFDTWFSEMATLAQTDPEAFERRRAQLIEEAIANSKESYQDNLRRLQWRIDMERKRAKTPLASCIKIYDMLLDFVYGPNGFLEAINKLRALADALQRGERSSLEAIVSTPSELEQTSRKVIPFPRVKR